MSQAAYVSVDWGTSSFRLWLVDRAGNVLGERRSHEGMIAAGKLGFATVLQSHLEAVGAAHGLPVIVCGMAGARQGWVEAGYVDTPAPLTSILRHAVRIPAQNRDIRILPGIAQRDPKAPDVMRGKEYQLLGALGADAADDAVVCMPGTHSKWVRVSGGTVERFATFMTGELFGVVSRETILSHAVTGADEAEDIDAFKSAVTAAFETCAGRQSAFPGAIGSAPLRRQAILGPRENIGNPDRSRIGGGARRSSTEERHHAGGVREAPDALSTGV